MFTVAFRVFIAFPLRYKSLCLHFQFVHVSVIFIIEFLSLFSLLFGGMIALIVNAQPKPQQPSAFIYNGFSRLVIALTNLYLKWCARVSYQSPWLRAMGVISMELISNAECSLLSMKDKKFHGIANTGLLFIQIDQKKFLIERIFSEKRCCKAIKEPTQTNHTQNWSKILCNFIYRIGRVQFLCAHMSMCFLLLILLSFKVVVQVGHKECPIAIVIQMAFVFHHSQDFEENTMHNQLNGYMFYTYIKGE